MSDLRAPAYWVGHFFTVAATIIGVYYAATVGFEVALKLELVRADRGTYYVSESMYQELEFNIENMEKYIKNIEDKKYVYKEHIAGIQLNEYVFKSAMYSDSVFEIEPSLLTEVSIYYFSVGNAIKHYIATDMGSPSSLMDVVKKQTALLATQNTVKRLEAYNRALAGSVESRGVDLAQPEFEMKK